MRMENLNHKIEIIQRKYLKKAKEPIFKGKKESFRIRKRLRRTEKQKIKKQRSKN